ncbi:D-glycero-beta-D-manno-heptose-7-phosphate kinase [Pelagibius litoralis]|uniref:Bifunctional protein HldE n=1 Tax=Pelagibius litoralis TaxID=374515 RepID=A0A967C288_9PROT|nr:D-glycero-beta-D-manno-heptose-7-phosphate kinase [Pelagibius litoralis]NIA68093.1 D-glycero-beta-D-manno-heptose-7-phosphate kinase [Pelagibius litoralis]
MKEETDLTALIGRLKAVPVLVLGDIMLDRFVYGSVERISPEAPIPVMRIEREAAMLGGAGNVLRNLAALGARPLGVGVIGKDAAGEEVAALAGRCLAPVDGTIELLPLAGRPTTIKERFAAGGQQLLRADREASGVLDGDGEAAVIAAALSALDEAAAVVLSDYGKGLLTPAVVKAVIDAARRRGCALVVDPKGRDFSRYRGASWVTPNRRELQDASGLAGREDDDVVAACRKIMNDCGIDAVLATRSEQGMTLVGSGVGSGQPAAATPVHHLKARAREVYDVSGAGDTVVAVFAAALAAGLQPVQAAGLANTSAAIVVGKLGTAVAQPHEITQALHASDLMAAESKIVDLDTLLERAARWRQAGLRIGFTNGCFDLLHPGHVSLLHQAEAACDRLVVGLNSDASVRRLKGESRPIQSEAARAAVLASLASVSRVVVFSEDTPMAVIEALRPDVLVKGADYSVDQVVGADVVQGYGGRVVLADLSPGHSTTATIERLERSRS